MMSKRDVTKQVSNGFIAALIMLFVVILSGCTASGGQNTNIHPTVVKMDASWHMRYANAQSAKQDPAVNLIMAGTVTSLQASQKQGPLVTTDAIFTITRIAWNPQKLNVGSAIAVRTLGGTIGNTRYEVDDLPMYQVGEHEILFLHVDSATGIAEALGGPSGRLLVQNGIVKPLNSEGMDVPPNTSEDTFLSSIPSA